MRELNQRDNITVFKTIGVLIREQNKEEDFIFYE